MDQRTDEELIAGSIRGRKEDFRLLVERYEGELYNFIYRCVGDRAASEDLFQETFFQVFSKIESFDPGKRFRPWLYTIAANLARDEMRRRRRRKFTSLDAELAPGGETSLAQLVDSRSAGPGEALDGEESASVARELLKGLPEALREVSVLYFYNDMKYAQISEALGLPMGTVKSRLYRAIRLMGATLERRRGC